jgi:hypothetical protein
MDREKARMLSQSSTEASIEETEQSGRPRSLKSIFRQYFFIWLVVMFSHYFFRDHIPAIQAWLSGVAIPPVALNDPGQSPTKKFLDFEDVRIP